MDAGKIQELIESGLKRHYRVKVGDRVNIELPRVPLTRHTQYLKLEPSLQDVGGVLRITPETESDDGILAPASLSASALRPGKGRILITAANRLSGETVSGVEPVAIEVEVYG